MPSYKDETGKWYCKFYYIDFTGQMKQKLKRGFNLKREADQWEKDYLDLQAGTPDTTFKAVCEDYLSNKKKMLKQSSWYDKQSRLNTWVLPYFSDRPIKDISASDVKNWQEELKTAKNAKGRPLAPGYLQNIVTEASSVFNYAMKHYDLPENPLKKTGNMIGKKNRSMTFWTEKEFTTFIQTFDKRDPYYAAFMTLYYTGLRKGELLALTPEDIDLDKGMIHVTKTYHVIEGEEIITDPKTEESKRFVPIPHFLCDVIRDHEKRIHGLSARDRVFMMSDTRLSFSLDKHIKGTGLKRIRIHDLRHSHVSLLIELGFSALVISKRIGHKDVTTTLNVYAHLFPNRDTEVADRLQELFENSPLRSA